MKPERKLKIVVFAGYACNNSCVFCVNADKRGLPERGWEELAREIYRAAALKPGVLELIGGEATIRPDFLRLVALAKKLGVPEVVCATNGRAFADAAFARSAVKAGLGSLIFSVHGPDAKTHDSLTGVKGSFAALRRGLANLRRLGFTRINGNTTVVKGNMRRLPELARFYIRNKVRNVEFIFVDPSSGGAKSAFREVVPRISAAAPYMRRALAAGLKAGYDQWKARYVPLCFFKGFETQVSELAERELYHTEHWAQDFRNRDASASRAKVGRKKTSRCRGCALYEKCEGLWKSYLERYGDKELKPVK